MARRARPGGPTHLIDVGSAFARRRPLEAPPRRGGDVVGPVVEGLGQAQDALAPGVRRVGTQRVQRRRRGGARRPRRPGHRHPVAVVPVPVPVQIRVFCVRGDVRPGARDFPAVAREGRQRRYHLAALLRLTLRLVMRPLELPELPLVQPR